MEVWRLLEEMSKKENKGTKDQKKKKGWKPSVVAR